MQGQLLGRLQRERNAIALLLASASVLTACEGIESIEKHGLAASAFHAAYCESGKATRERLELMLVFENGSAKLDIHCDPHRAPDEFYHPPAL